MSENDVYSIEESSVYSYQDLAIYQYSDAEEPSPARSSVFALHDNDYDDDWHDYENDSYVMHADSDNGDDMELYQFSDDDLVPEEPDEEWLIAALLSNRQDFRHLELVQESLDDFPRLIEAIQGNRVVRSVTIYEKFFDSIPTDEAKTVLAETICRIHNLEHLNVYSHGSHFVDPLERIRPPKLTRLCLMFLPERANKETLAALTRIMNDEMHSEGTTPSLLESLSLRCEVMDDEFLRAVALGMEGNSTLETLSFWGNKDQYTVEGVNDSAKIDFFLRLNQSGIRDLYLLVNATPSEFLDKIACERLSLDLVFYLLQNNPSFLSYSTFL